MVTVVALELQLWVPVEVDAEHQRYCRARAESRVGGGRGLFCNAAISQIQHLSHMPARRCDWCRAALFKLGCEDRRDCVGYDCKSRSDLDKQKERRHVCARASAVGGRATRLCDCKCQGM